MKRSRLLLLLSVPLFFACSNENNAQKEPSDTVPVNTLQQPKTVKEVEERLFKADSLQVIYYDNPDGDSLRYSRYFTYTEINNTARVSALLQEMNQVFVQEPAARNCRSEGKIFLLNGEDILKTVYFSTRKDSCSYFYFIKDGNFFYFPVTEKAKRFLTELKTVAKKPVANPE